MCVNITALTGTLRFQRTMLSRVPIRTLSTSTLRRAQQIQVCISENTFILAIVENYRMRLLLTPFARRSAHFVQSCRKFLQQNSARTQ